jgi:DNA-binding PadR family transcriptional regulator
MLYELLILSLLVREPAHGYLIAKIINDLIGPYARISNGRLYPLLARLEADGLIALQVTPETPGERHSRHYQITEAGFARWLKLMLDTTSNPGEYQRIFYQKVPNIHLLEPAQRLYLFDHYLNYCQAHVLHLIAETEDLATRVFPDEKAWQGLPAMLDVMNHKIAQWRLEMQWAAHLRDQELASQRLGEAGDLHG